MNKKIYNKLYYKENRTKISIQKKNQYKQNAQERKEQIKEYKQNHKEEVKTYLKQYYQEHKEKLINNMRQYRKIHKQEEKVYRQTPIKKLINYYRNRIWSVLKRNTKSAHTEELLGCTVEHLKQHLESQFTKGMNWKNYGKWHVDHIRPCASFDLSIPEEQYKCFNYSNLQPLWAEDNLHKHASLLVS